VFGLLVLAMTFLGAVYYPWTGLEPLPWVGIQGFRRRVLT
jgi:hypothetical protein